MHKPLFHLFGIPIIVQWPFYVVMAIIGGAMHAMGPEAWVRVAIFVAAGFLSILIHELGHAMTARRFGAFVPAIVLHAFGGLCYFDGKSFTRKENILVTAAGPGAGLSLAAISCLLYIALQNHVLIPEAQPLVDPRAPMEGIFQYGAAIFTHLGWFLFVLILVNIFWSVFNLFPIIPMDGGQIMRQALGPGKVQLALQISFITAIILGIVAFNFNYWIATIFLAWMAWENWKMMQSQTS